MAGLILSSTRAFRESISLLKEDVGRYGARGNLFTVEARAESEAGGQSRYASTNEIGEEGARRTCEYPTGHLLVEKENDAVEAVDMRVVDAPPSVTIRVEISKLFP
jgi:hypothetical protein